MGNRYEHRSGSFKEEFNRRASFEWSDRFGVNYHLEFFIKTGIYERESITKDERR